MLLLKKGPLTALILVSSEKEEEEEEEEEEKKKKKKKKKKKIFCFIAEPGACANTLDCRPCFFFSVSPVNHGLMQP